MCIGASLRRPSAVDSLSQSSLERRPVRIFCWSRRPVDPMMRMASCVAPISMLKMATGIFEARAMCSPMLSASEVLPMLGRPAITIRSPSCSPEVMRSRSVKPVAIPVTSEGLSRL